MKYRFFTTNLFTILSFFSIVFLIACNDDDENTCEDFAVTASGSENLITLDITAGSAPYDYTVTYTSGDTQTSSTDDISVTFTADIYEAATIVLTDASGCTATTLLAEGVLFDPCEDLTVAVSGEGDQITLNISEGTVPFDYVITYTDSDTDPTVQSNTTSDEVTVITAAAYTGASIAVTDASGCTETMMLDEGILTDPCADFSFTVTGDDELVVFDITAGTAPYSYVITYEGEATESGVLDSQSESIEPTVYEAATVALTDANGCTTTADLAAPCTDFSFETNVSDGTVIEFDIAGGVAPFDYVITYENDEETVQNGEISERDEEVEAEAYAAATIKLTDALGCVVTVSLEEGELVDPCDALTVTAIGSDGEITMTIEGGVAPFDYTIAYEGSATTDSDTGVTETEFTITASVSAAATITVTDDNGCETSTVVSEDDLANSFYDFRDGQRYETVEINGVTWLAENFNYDDGTGECYDNEEDNCVEYGKLYTWNDAMAEDFAPEGWRLPTLEEVEALKTHLGVNPGTKLKEEQFAAKLGGSKVPAEYVAVFGEFSSLGDNGDFWTSEEDDTNEGEAISMQILDVSSNITFSNLSFDWGLSVRLIRDID